MPLTRPKAHQLSGQSAKSSVRVVTTSNVTLSGGAPATVDGVSLTLEDRILVTAQTDATENGIYRVTSVGSGSNGTWVRGRDANQNEEVLAGMTTMVSEGTTYADTFWKLTTDGAVTLGTTELVFEQHSTVEAKSIANLSDVTLTSTSSNDVLTYNGSAWVNSTSIDLSGNIDGANINVDDTLRIAQSGSGLRMTNVGAFDNNGSDNFRVFATNDLILAANGESGTAITIDATNQDVAVSNDLTVSGTITTAGSITASGRVATDEVSAHGLSSTSSLTLRGGVSSDGIKLQFWDSSWTDALAIRESTHDILASYPFTATGNITGGNLRADNLTTQNAFAIVGSDNNLIQDTTLSVDPASNFLGINQTSPEVTLHMTGEGAQTAQIRMEQYNDSSDAPDVRTRRYRGTIASPSAVQAGDYLYRSNHEYWNGSALIVGGQFAFDNINDANRTQFTIAVTTDGTSVEASSNDDVHFKIDGNDSGAITFNNAYKFPTADGSANNILATDGSGALTFTGDPTFTTVTTTGDVTVSGDLDIDDADSVFLHGDAGYINKRYVLYGTTTDATTTEIFVGGTTNSRVAVANNTTMFYTVDIVARRTDATGESAGWQLKGVADNFSGTTADVGDVYEVAVARDDTNWEVDALAGDTEDAIVVTVTGAAGKTVKWMAVVKTMEIAN